MTINWGLGVLNGDPGAAFLGGMQQGRQLRKERDTENALSAYASNPNDPNAVSALIRADPRLGIQVQERQRAQQAQMQERQVMSGALRGDQGSMDALAGLNPEMWMKLDDRTKQKLTRATDFMAQSGLQIGQLPEDQRSGAWNSAVRQAESMGLDIPTEYERYSPEVFNAAMATTGKMGEFLDRMKVEWKTVGEGGAIPVSAGTGQRVDIPGAQAVGIGGVGQSSPSIAPSRQQLDSAQFLRKSDAAALRQASPAKYDELIRGGARIVPDNFDQVMNDAKDAISRGADPNAVYARTRQILGIQ